MHNNSQLGCEGVEMAYGTGPNSEIVLNDVSLQIKAGQSCLLLGPSGSGKTTLLSILGCMLSPTAGKVFLNGDEVIARSGDARTIVRRKHIGFVFQHAQLLPFLTLWENVVIPARNSGLNHDESQKRAGALFDRLDLNSYRNKRPSEISGGQRQRVALARALIHRPTAVLADEPTAALDWDRGLDVIRLMIEQCREYGTALLTVSHDTRLCTMFERILRIDRCQLQEAT